MIIARILSAVFLVVLIILALLFHRVDWPRLESILSAIPYRCPLKLWTGWECAFCGMTHSWIALLRGEWKQAIQFNAFGPLVFAASILFSLAMIGGFNLTKKIKPWMAAVSVCALAIYAVIRNL